MKRRNKRCSIERLKGVSKRLKGHLLQAKKNYSRKGHYREDER
ncbi:hypothetical protein HMPREF9148_00073 [Prevotella sp. F0091]|nr:hypothetical protein HMPREF9148_00073 [Prevotella sp. F0091]